MDLSTKYMGFDLPHPLVPGASPLMEDLDMVRRLEDAGAPMIIMTSLFEEQIVDEQLAVTRSLEHGDDTSPEAISYFPKPRDFALGPDQYLEHLRRLKEAVSVPVIASLNGVTEGGWVSFARQMQEAGADGLELNLYDLTVDPLETGQAVEERALAVVRAVRAAVTVPLAVKLSPFYSSIANFAHRLDELGADALVLFNRFYQPDIDVDELELIRVNLSTSTELSLRLRWIAVLWGHVRATLGVTGGVHTAADAIKSLMAGASAVQLVSALLEHGPGHLAEVRGALEAWLVEREYESLGQMIGSMSLRHCPDPHVYERANYMRVLHSWHR